MYYYTKRLMAKKGSTVMQARDIVILLSERLRLVRSEYNLTQERMAEILGLSKKTLVQVEKERSLLSWPAAVTLATIFSDSEILKVTLGGEPVELLRTVALANLPAPRERTMGGEMWWNELEIRGNFRLQQNIISGHYRIIDSLNRRWFSSFDQQFIRLKLRELTQEPCETAGEEDWQLSLQA